MDYIHINENEFFSRKHKKQREEDIAVCVCEYDESDPDSACGEGCLNVLTNTECTPGYCPCGVHCINQRFQNRMYAKTKLFKTDGRGCGLLADENITAGQFIIEYCGEVITSKEAELRAQSYEARGIKDAYIISLNAYESIDATIKGSLARFINHSCDPNCETRKWTVLGEMRVGIFAKVEVPPGTELTYNYNFEWYGGAKVRCLCGAANCCGFLGAKSRGFQEDTYLWEDDDGRFSVEKIPLYDSAEDEPSSKLSATSGISKQEFVDTAKENCSLATNLCSGSNQPLDSTPMNGLPVNATKNEPQEMTNLSTEDAQQAFVLKNTSFPHTTSDDASQKDQKGKDLNVKKKQKGTGRRNQAKSAQRQVDIKHLLQVLSDKKEQDEILSYEESSCQCSLTAIGWIQLIVRRIFMLIWAMSCVLYSFVYEAEESFLERTESLNKCTSLFSETSLSCPDLLTLSLCGQLLPITTYIHQFYVSGCLHFGHHMQPSILPVTIIFKLIFVITSSCAIATACHLHPTLSENVGRKWYEKITPEDW